MSSLCDAFLAAHGSDAEPTQDLEEALQAIIAAATSAWPEVEEDHLAFSSFLGQRIPSDIDPVHALRTRNAGDLYLVFASLRGNPIACASLEDLYLRELVDRLVRQRIDEELAIETVQQLRMRMLVGDKPLLLAYGGTGDLRGWLRITALRAAIRARRSAMRRGERDQESELADAALDADLQYQRKLYGEEFRAAFAEAVASLTVRERNLLKHSVLYGATSDDLGALYRVHRATAARWLVSARDRLAAETQRRMVERLKIDRSEYESIMRLIQSQLDVSVARVLA